MTMTNEKSKLWFPNKELCTTQEELRQETEWLRKSRGLDSGTPPSQLGLDSYTYGNPLHKSFYEGRTPPPVRLDSNENIEWYTEQIKRCVYGHSHGNQRITGTHYFFLNFYAFPVMEKDPVTGELTPSRKVNYPYYSVVSDYIFKCMEEARLTGKGFALMSGRGVGKTYIALSEVAKTYLFKKDSHCVISGSADATSAECFGKMRSVLNQVAHLHPTLALNRLIDTQSMIKSGQKVIRDGKELEEGPMSVIEKITYGSNAGVTRGRRLDVQVLEEIGEWAEGNANLKNCIAGSVGSWKVGSLVTCLPIYIGTGGSVKSDQAKDVFLDPKAYNILPLKDFGGGAEGDGNGCFIPSHYYYGGFWERTGVNDTEGAKKYLDEERAAKKSDIVQYEKNMMEYPKQIKSIISCSYILENAA